MTQDDKLAFAELMTAVFAAYDKQISNLVLDFWWSALQQHDLATLREAFERHYLSPDQGTFLPRPADILRMLGGTTQDAAMLAWTKVMDGLSHIGSYETVCFDDPVINQVIAEMGGWIAIGQTDEDECPFKEKEFVVRYRAHANRGLKSWPRLLEGICDRDNAACGYSDKRSVILIGDPARAQQTYSGGGDFAGLRAMSMKLEHKPS